MKHPTAAGRLVLQDLPEVIASAKTQHGIEKQVHDFFNPKPVQKARAYFLHSILHNWPDDKCKDILLALKPVMSPETRILIFDLVISDINPSQLSCTIDMRMLWNFGFKERSEQDWQKLVEAAGLKIIRMHRPSRDGASILEVQL